MVTGLAAPKENDEDREFWSVLGAAGLARAYGSDEPDISGNTVLGPTPEYRK